MMSRPAPFTDPIPPPSLRHEHNPIQLTVFDALFALLRCDTDIWSDQTSMLASSIRSFCSTKNVDTYLPQRVQKFTIESDLIILVGRFLTSQWRFYCMLRD
jgi:hypothetical protein